MKKLLKRIIGDVALGHVDWYRRRESGQPWGGPFNGQAVRAALFNDILAKTRPVALVETGTYLGSTTELLAATELPVYTIEANARSYGFARARLRRLPNVVLVHGDSRTVLPALLNGPLETRRKECLFFYLDAHWNDELPVLEELAIVFSHCPKAIAMIDDFQVPEDPGYEYDLTETGQAMNLEYIRDEVAARDLAAFFPAVPAVEESGYRRGAVVLCSEPSHRERLAKCELLRTA